VSANAGEGNEKFRKVCCARGAGREAVASVKDPSLKQIAFQKVLDDLLPEGEEGFFPATILAQAKRRYISAIGRQMNGCYASGWRDACAVMMRRLLEIVIIEAFEAKGIGAKIKGADDTYFHLSKLIDLALAEPRLTLSRNTKIALPKLRDAEHLSAHGRYFLAAPEEIIKMQKECRVALEEFLHHAELV
jgi:hypothetical protein